MAEENVVNLIGCIYHEKGLQLFLDHMLQLLTIALS